MKLTNKDYEEIGYIVLTGETSNYSGYKWTRAMNDMGNLCMGQPEKARQIMKEMRNVDYKNATQRKILNTYLEMLLYVTSKMNIPDNLNT